MGSLTCRVCGDLLKLPPGHSGPIKCQWCGRETFAYDFGSEAKPVIAKPVTASPSLIIPQEDRTTRLQLLGRLLGRRPVLATTSLIGVAGWCFLADTTLFLWFLVTLSICVFIAVIVKETHHGSITK